MKDHTVPVSNQTTLSGARPLLCPPTHTTMAARRASSTRQHRGSGSSWWGDPAVDEDPGGHPARPLVVVLLVWWLAIRMLTSYVRREALPLMAVAPHPPAVALSRIQYIDPGFATHATAPSDNPWYLKHLLPVYVPVWPALQRSIANSHLRHMCVDRLESTWDRG